MYYRYLDRFKVRPETFQDLFDLVDYCTVDSNLVEYKNSLDKMKNGG